MAVIRCVPVNHNHNYTFLYSQFSLILTQTSGSWYNPPRFDMTWCPCQFSPEQNHMPVPFSLCTMTVHPWFLWCSSGTASRGQCSEPWSSNAGKAGPNKIDKTNERWTDLQKDIWCQIKKAPWDKKIFNPFYCVQSSVSKILVLLHMYATILHFLHHFWILLIFS